MEFTKLYRNLLMKNPAPKPITIWYNVNPQVQQLGIKEWFKLWAPHVRNSQFRAMPVSLNEAMAPQYARAVVM